MTDILIEARALSQRRRHLQDWRVALPMRATWSLRDLLAHLVDVEVKAFRDRQAERRFMHLLSPNEIESAAAQGKVSSGMSEVPPQSVDLEAAIATAWQSFEDGIYFVFVDEQKIESLDASLSFGPDSRVRLVRLTPLAGG